MPREKIGEGAHWDRSLIGKIHSCRKILQMFIFMLFFILIFKIFFRISYIQLLYTIKSTLLYSHTG